MLLLRAWLALYGHSCDQMRRHWHRQLCNIAVPPTWSRSASFELRELIIHDMSRQQDEHGAYPVLGGGADTLDDYE